MADNAADEGKNKRHSREIKTWPIAIPNSKKMLEHSSYIQTAWNAHNLL